MLVCFGSSGEASYAALMMALTLVILAFLAFEKGGESMLQAGSSSYLPEKSSLMDAAQASSAPQMTMSLTLSSVLYMQHHLKPVWISAGRPPRTFLTHVETLLVSNDGPQTYFIRFLNTSFAFYFVVYIYYRLQIMY